MCLIKTLATLMLAGSFAAAMDWSLEDWSLPCMERGGVVLLCVEPCPRILAS